MHSTTNSKFSKPKKFFLQKIKIYIFKTVILKISLYVNSIFIENAITFLNKSKCGVFVQILKNFVTCCVT